MRFHEMKLLREHERLGGGEISRWLHESKEREILTMSGFKPFVAKSFRPVRLLVMSERSDFHRHILE